jgi:hypothetical protein
MYGLLADLLVAVHLAYVAYVVVGQLLILVGVVLRWGWVRNPWFRVTHLLAIAIVAVETVFEIECPLTVWERGLRGLAGQEFSGDNFVARLLHSLLFLNLPHWAFPVIHIGLATLVIGTFVLAPPRWRRVRPRREPSSP